VIKLNYFLLPGWERVRLRVNKMERSVLLPPPLNLLPPGEGKAIRCKMIQAEINRQLAFY
jgi:hypothetical protein